MNIKHKFVNAPVCRQFFCVLYTYDKIEYGHEQRNKVKQTDIYTICHTKKQMYKLNEKKNSAFIFP